MPTQLLPPIRQTLWGRLAVANFFLGGAGAGAYLVAVALTGFAPAPLLAAASLAAALLVLAGFLAVAAEAGRPLRGPRVLSRPGSSWMTRESWAGGAFVILAVLDLLRPWAGWRLGATVAAVAFALAQGFVLARCRGVVAWSVPLLPPLFLASSLLSGAAVLALTTALLPDARGAVSLAVAVLVPVSALGWSVYAAWPGGPAFRRVADQLRGDTAVFWLFIVGHLLPLALLVLGWQAGGFAVAAATLAGAAVLIGQLRAKTWLILWAELRPITLGT